VVSICEIGDGGFLPVVEQIECVLGFRLLDFFVFLSGADDRCGGNGRRCIEYLFRRVRGNNGRG
jgi:hypothetical protein